MPSIPKDPRRERAERGVPLRHPKSSWARRGMFSPTTPNRRAVWKEEWGEGEYLLQDHNHHLGGHWVLKLPARRPTTECF